MNNPSTSIKVCFVCDQELNSDDFVFHPKVHLPICNGCVGTPEEKSKTDELLEGLAERFVCGCI